jgi:hypothetical protein
LQQASCRLEYVHSLAHNNRLHEPVHIARLSWRPLVGEVKAEGIAVGADGARVSAGQVLADIALRRLLHREIVFDQLVIDRPAATVELDDHYIPTLAGSSSKAVAGDATAPPLPVTVHRLIVSNGETTVRLPLQGRTRDAKVEIARLVDRSSGGLRDRLDTGWSWTISASRPRRQARRCAGAR